MPKYPNQPLTLAMIGDMMLDELSEYHKRAKELQADSSDALLEARNILRAIKAGAVVTPGGEVSPERIEVLLNKIGFTEEEHAAHQCDCKTRPAGSSRSALLMHRHPDPQPASEAEGRPYNPANVVPFSPSNRDPKGVI